MTWNDRGPIETNSETHLRYLNRDSNHGSREYKDYIFVECDSLWQIRENVSEETAASIFKVEALIPWS